MEQKTQRNEIRRFLLWFALVMIALLIAMSIYGAFIGADRAQQFFNSLPLAVYWVAFAAVLIAGFGSFNRLLCVRGPLLIHMGCVLVLAGGIWGSKTGHKIQNKLFGLGLIPPGQMVIYEDSAERAVVTEDGREKQLPFEVKLVDFKLKYYEPGILIARTREGVGYRMPAEPGGKYLLSDELGSVEIIRRFENFKLVFENGIHIAVDDPNGGPNPALELLLTSPDGNETIKYVFERFAGHAGPDDKLLFHYQRMIRDYISVLEIIKDGKVVKKKDVEVNHPLHYAGYLFYQHSYDDEAQSYTILGVKSDSGLLAVHLGFTLLCAGVFWHMWLRYIFGDREIED